MDNNKSRGIFLGVLSVATLIVSIIGATFAYFVANTSGNTWHITKIVTNPIINANPLSLTSIFLIPITY